MDRHVYGVFLRIKEKNNPNSRIYVMELPSGKFISGKIPTETIINVELRHIISVDMTDVDENVTDINKIVFNEKYDIQPSVYPRNIDTNLL
jgi:hypothetical protein